MSQGGRWHVRPRVRCVPSRKIKTRHFSYDVRGVRICTTFCICTTLGVCSHTTLHIQIHCAPHTVAPPVARQHDASPVGQGDQPSGCWPVGWSIASSAEQKP